jgi:PIN domain nuclease of toxin-antitoxin system
VILLDTHIWVWWTHGDTHLPPAHRTYLQEHESQGLGVSIISCWEVAKLVERGRLALSCPVAEWFDQALAYPGVSLLALTPAIIVEATQLPGIFHKDPADQLIVATARVHALSLVTLDQKICTYPHVHAQPSV